MSIKEMTIRELEDLRPEELLRIHEFILFLKRRPGAPDLGGRKIFFEDVQRLLAGCPGNLSDDVSRDRDGRG